MRQNVGNLQIALECSWQHFFQNLKIGNLWELSMVI
jgi:hypothetical protein